LLNESNLFKRVLYEQKGERLSFRIYRAQYFAEFIGTFFLVFFGCGAVIAQELNPNLINGLGIPLTFGAIVSVMIYSVGHISGAHLNPAVSIAFFVIGRFPKKKLIYYILAQFAGAISASAFHRAIWGGQHQFGMTSLSGGLVSGLAMEFILSFVLMFVIISVATDDRATGQMAGLAIGLIVGLCAWIGGPISGASMNPARSLSPALFAQDLSEIIYYLLLPVLGTISGAYIYEKIRCHNQSEESDQHGCC
jgi:MIP family channel proteins